MFRRTARAFCRPLRGILTAVGARPRTFAAVVGAVLVVDVFLPPLVLSAVRGPWTYFTFNPWLKKLPAYLTSPAPIGQKLDFLARVAIFWFSADGPYGVPEWGFAVDTLDVFRFLVTSLLFGAYFALWSYWRRRPVRPRWAAGTNRGGAVVGAATSVLGLSTAPCSVVGCGAPVLPVVGLAFAGLSSGTLALLSGLSRVATAVLVVTLTVAVGYFGWRVAGETSSPPRPARSVPE